VVNNSWGGGGGDAWYLSKVNAWRAAGISPAFSAGNSYTCGSIGSPGDYQESFTSADVDSGGNIANFSSKGLSVFVHEPYTKPNIAAPGVSVCSSVATNGWSCGYSGTSMASPHTAGAVALLWSCNSSLVGQVDLTF
jgi:subtilisin family serine protease